MEEIMGIWLLEQNRYHLPQQNNLFYYISDSSDRQSETITQSNDLILNRLERKVILL